MISIKVNNRQLYIPADTSLVLEQNNNSFDLDNFGSDIIWTFDIPARKNADALESAHYVCVSNHKKYRCEILFNGVVIANGDLYIQSVSDEETVSCGVVLDGLGEEFGKRMLRENDYGDDVVISQYGDSITQHREHWVQFLKNSLNDESPYKFFLFISEEFQKNNDDFGYHLGMRSTLRGLTSDDYCSTYVNRMFFLRNGSDIFIGNNEAGSQEGGIGESHLFNQQGSVLNHINGYCFAPALRLDWLVRQVFRTAGYTVSGDFLEDSRIKNLYVQSMNAMDGDSGKLGSHEYFYITGNVLPPTTLFFANHIPVVINDLVYNLHKRQGNSTDDLVFHFGFDADLSTLVTGQTVTPTINQPWDRYDEVYMLLVRPADDAFHDIRPEVRCKKSGSDGRFVYGNFADCNTIPLTYTKRLDGETASIDRAQIIISTNGRCIIADGVETFSIIQQTECYCVQLTGSNAYNPANTAGVYDMEGTFNVSDMAVDIDAGKNLVVEFVRARISTISAGATNRYYQVPGSTEVLCLIVSNTGLFEKIETLEVVDKTNISNINGNLNIFDTALRWREHVPDLSNGDFIKALCKAFGLSIYVNPFQREVQLSFSKNVFKSSAIDITSYIETTERKDWEPVSIVRRIESVREEKDMREDYILEDVNDKRSLGRASAERNRVRFVSNENLSRKSTRDNETNIFQWEQYGGNNRALVTGSDYVEVDEETIPVKIPNMRWVDEVKEVGQTTSSERFICEIAEKGNSQLFDEDYDGKFDLILMQRHPARLTKLGNPDIGYGYEHQGWFYETANPTSLDSLAATVAGTIDLALAPNRTDMPSDCIGERWLRRMLTFKADMERYTFQARLPLSMFLQVYRTQQPQHVAVCDEKRWIVVKNRRYMPIKISYEFGKGDYVLTTIECARQHFD